MWGQIIGGAVSALGSLFGGSDDETTTSTVNYSEMVKKAEKAGFNPLTAIRNGGSAGFTSTTHHPALSASIGQAAGAIGSALASFDPHAQQRADMEFKLAEAQLANLNADTATRQRTWFGNVPTYTAGQKARVMGGQTMAGVRTPMGGAGPNGEILPLYQKWYDPRDNKVVELPNANLPESEQFMVPALGSAENAILKPIIENKAKDGGWITARPLSPAEVKKQNDSWHGGWLPGISFQ